MKPTLASTCPARTELNRRVFLTRAGSAVAGLSLLKSGSMQAADAKPTTVGLAGFAESREMAAMRREMRNRQRRIIYNDDGCGPLWAKDGGNTPEHFLRGPHSRMNAVLGTQVDSVFICSGATHVLNHPSSVAESYADVVDRYGITVDGFDRFRDNMRALEALGTDAIRLTVGFCKQNRKEVFYSFRVNDLHLAQGGSMNVERSTWWRKNPHYWLGKPANLSEQEARKYPATDPRCWGWAALNFELPEVRAYLLSILDEVANKYDLDGIEIDYLRAPLFFLPNLEQKPTTEAQRDILTEFQRQVRLVALRAGQKRGRPMLAAARVPSTTARCRYAGIDIPRWLQGDIVDVVSLGGGYVPLNAEWPELIRLGRSCGVPVYPVLSASGFRGPYGAIEMWRAAASNAYHAGATGVYLFNHFPNKPSAQFKELGDPKTLATMDKVFVVENDPDGYWGHYICLLDSFAAKDARSGQDSGVGVRPAGRLLPMPLDPAAENVVFLTIGDDLAKAAADKTLKTAVLRVQLSSPDAVNSVTVHLNGEPLTVSAKDAVGGWLSFAPPASGFKTGQNRVTFKSPPGPSVEVRAVEAHVKYRQ